MPIQLHNIYKLLVVSPFQHLPSYALPSSSPLLWSIIDDSTSFIHIFLLPSLPLMVHLWYLGGGILIPGMVHHMNSNSPIPPLNDNLASLLPMPRHHYPTHDSKPLELLIYLSITDIYSPNTYDLLSPSLIITTHTYNVRFSRFHMARKVLPVSLPPFKALRYWILSLCLLGKVLIQVSGFTVYSQS